MGKCLQLTQNPIATDPHLSRMVHLSSDEFHCYETHLSVEFLHISSIPDPKKWMLS